MARADRIASSVTTLITPSIVSAGPGARNPPYRGGRGTVGEEDGTGLLDGAGRTEGGAGRTSDGGAGRTLDGIASAPPGPGSPAGAGPGGTGRVGLDGAPGAPGSLVGGAQSLTVVGSGVPPGPRAALAADGATAGRWEVVAPAAGPAGDGCACP
ncbi:hypothetical protein FK529_12470, partial [Tsukamurella asaccharolytica]